MILAFQLSNLVTVPFGWLLGQLYQLTNNYGIAMIIFAVLVKIILMPATAKSKKSSMKMSRLAPRQKAIQEKYANDPQKQNEAMQALYKEEGVSMGGGCLWSMLPLFILIPLFTVIRQPIVYMLGEDLEVAEKIVEVIKGLSAEGVFSKNAYYDQVVAAKYIPQFLPQLEQAGIVLSETAKAGVNFSFLGIDLGLIPTFNVFAWDALLSAGSQVLSMHISMKMNNSVVTNEKGLQDEETAKNSQANQSGKVMMWTMPLMSLWIGFTVPSALSLYWFIQGIISMVADVYLTKKYRITENPSKKKLQQKQQREAEAAKAAVAKEYAAKKGIVEEVEEEKTTLSGIADRPYCKGRAYDPNRYSNASTEE